jgi:NAD(P)-dependent dehydrogenase (short-subunit alcohol dehydrogenase family)
LATEPAAVITGCSTGIGRASARLLEREGFRVFAGVRTRGDAEALRSEGAGRLEPLLLDVTDEAAIERAVAEVGAAVGEAGLAGLVNNAGIAIDGPLEFVDLAEMRRCYDVNVFGPVAVTKAFLPLLRRASGRIVNVSSGAGRVATPLIGAYSSTKSALESLSEAQRVELRGFGVHLSVVAPGTTSTPMQEKGLEAVDAQLASLPEEGLAAYGSALARMRAMFVRLERGAVPAETVARVIHRALTDARPRARYAVGRDTRLMGALARFVPARARDALFGRLVGL